MNRFLWLAAVPFLFCSNQVMAQICTNASTGMTATAIQKLLVGNYARVGTYPNAQWNELHSGGANGYVLDYKLGPKSKTDPSDTTAHPTGTYAITPGANGEGIITYDYGTQSYSYYIVDNLTHPQYSFCTTGGGQDLAVTVSSSPT